MSPLRGSLAPDGARLGPLPESVARGCGSDRRRGSRIDRREHGPETARRGGVAVQTWAGQDADEVVLSGRYGQAGERREWTVPTAGASMGGKGH